MSLHPVECEAIGLHIASTALDSFVNHILLRSPASGGHVSFKGIEHRQLFAVRFLDFLENVDSNMTGVTGSCVDLLSAATQTRSFDQNGSVAKLEGPLETLRGWLDERIKVKIWFPSIDLDGEMLIIRSDFLYVCGNTSKHNLARLTGVARRLKRVLAQNAYVIDDVDASLVLEDFYALFHEDILTYYGAWVTELLNNVRWGIHEYLEPEFRRAFTPDRDDPTRYSYAYPVGLDGRFAKWCYWDLMNTVRATPPFPRFEAPEYLKAHHLAHEIR